MDGKKQLAVKRPYEDLTVAVVEEGQVRPGIPKFKKANYVHDQPTRYCDMALFELRRKCEEICKARKDKIATIPLYACSVNVLSKDRDKNFIPIEIGIYAYSLKEGKIGEPYHVIINAGDVPDTKLTPSLEHKNTHKITFRTHSSDYPPCASKNYKKIYREIMAYVAAGERTLLIQEAKYLDQVTSSFEWLYKKATEDGSKFPKVSTLSIFPITEFVGTMYNYVWQEIAGHSGPKFALHYFLKEQIAKTTSELTFENKCAYHQIYENDTIWCARSLSISMFHLMSYAFESCLRILELAQKSIEHQPAPDKLQPAEQPLAIMPASGQIPGQSDPMNASCFLTPLEDAPKDPRLTIDPRLAKLDPRIASGLLKPEPPTPQPAYVPVEATPTKKPSRPKSPLIIASTGVINPDNPPDIY